MSIADKLTYLQNTKQLLKTEINKINNVLTDNSTFRSYPQELFNGYLDILNNGTDTLWNNLEKVSQTGTETVLEGVETAPMKMVLNGNTSQDGTPTPDTPVEVKVVTGNNVVSVSGKNLLPIINVNGTYSNVQVTTNEDGSITLNGTASSNYAINIIDNWSLALKNSKTYTLSGCPNFSDSSYVVLELYSNSPSNQYVTDIGQGKTFTLTSDRTYRCYIAIKGGKTYDNVTFYPMVEENSQATPYVPYSKTDYPISLGTLELCKIGDYQDYLYKNNGKWYLEKQIGKVVLDGSERWELGTIKDITRIFQLPLNTTLINKKNNNNDFFSDHFINQIGDTEKIGWSTNYLYIAMKKTTTNTLVEFKTWLSTHNTIVYYVLATPTEEEITDTTLISQLEAIANAKSVKDKTYITQTNDDLPFILDVEAIKEYEVN